MPIPAFVQQLRSAVGTSPLWLSGVTAIVLDDEGRVLLGKRADNGRWAAVSGILEPGEEPAIAAARECAEETGVRVEVVALTSVTVSEEVTYPNGDRAQYLDVCFLCRPVSGEPHVSDDESTDVGWFPLDALPEPLNESTLTRLAHAQAYAAAGTDGQPHFVR